MAIQPPPQPGAERPLKEITLAKYETLMECRAGARHALKTVAIYEMPDGTHKVHRVCLFCKSEKLQLWGKNGALLKSPTYKHSAEYREFLNEHTPAEARVAILGSDFKKVKQDGKVTRLRLPAQGKQTPKRRGPAHARKRPRDKRRAHG